jgi:hypothetical protein
MGKILVLKSIQSVSLEKKDVSTASLIKRDILPVAFVLGGGVVPLFSTTQWQTITSTTWEAVTQTWD